MTIGRPLEFDPDIVLYSAMRLFWRQGYGSTSLQDLLSEMGLSKSSFYQAFKNKNKLFKKSIAVYTEQSTNNLLDKLEKADSGKSFFEAVFFEVADETCGKNARIGCLLMNTATEFSQTNPEISMLVSKSLEKITNIFEQAILLGQQSGEIKNDQNARTLAIYMVSSMSGVKNMVKAGADRETIKQIVTTILSVLR